MRETTFARLTRTQVLNSTSYYEPIPGFLLGRVEIIRALRATIASREDLIEL